MDILCGRVDALHDALERVASAVEGLARAVATKGDSARSAVAEARRVGASLRALRAPTQRSMGFSNEEIESVLGAPQAPPCVAQGSGVDDAAGADGAGLDPDGADAAFAIHGASLDDLVVEGVLALFMDVPRHDGQPSAVEGTTDKLWLDVEVQLAALGRAAPGARVFRSAKHFGRRLGMARGALGAVGFELYAARDPRRKRSWRVVRQP